MCFRELIFSSSRNNNILTIRSIISFPPNKSCILWKCAMEIQFIRTNHDLSIRNNRFCSMMYKIHLCIKIFLHISMPILMISFKICKNRIIRMETFLSNSFLMRKHWIHANSIRHEAGYFKNNTSSCYLRSKNITHRF